MRDTEAAGGRLVRTGRGARGEGLKAVVFDLDGTLANTRPSVTRLLVKVASEQGREVTVRQAAAAMGKPPGTAFGHLLGMPEGHSAVIAAITRYRELYTHEVLREGPALLYPGVASGLAAVRAQGLEVAVATSKVSRSAVVLLDVMGIRDLVGPVICQDMVRRGKPHPEMLMRTAAELGVTPRDCAYVGDTANDMRMAVTAGMEAVAVTYGVGSFAELAAVAGTHMCSTFTEVVAAVSAVRRRTAARAQAAGRAPAVARTPVAGRRR